MRLAVLALLLAVAAAASALQEQGAPDDSSAVAATSPQTTNQDVDDDGHPRSRPARWVVFKPMFAARAKQRQINRAMHNQELRRQWRAKGKRPRRALHFPVSPPRHATQPVMVQFLRRSGSVLHF